jgi:hypothetical protein
MIIDLGIFLPPIFLPTFLGRKIWGRKIKATAEAGHWRPYQPMPGFSPPAPSACRETVQAFSCHLSSSQFFHTIGRYKKLAGINFRMLGQRQKPGNLLSLAARFA